MTKRIPTIFVRALLFGLAAEAVALGITFGLYALKQGREPMEPPFNLAATILQMPGILLSDSFARTVGIYTAWFQWSVIYCAQSALWSIIGFSFIYWRANKET